MCRKIEKLEIQVTADCNLSCSYCGNDPMHRSSPDAWMNFNLFKKCLNEANPLELVLTGGEPTMLWDRIVQFFKYSKSLGIKNTLTSNMTLLNPHKIDFLVDECGVCSFNSSFNDLNDSMSTRVRGGTPEQRENICTNFNYIAQTKHLPLRVETLLIHETVPEIAQIHNFLYELGVRHHALEFLNPHGFAGWDMMLPLEILVDCVMKTYEVQKPDMLLELTCNYLNPCLEETMAIYQINDPNFIITNCYDGRKVAYITATGEMIPCFMFSGKMCNNNVKVNSIMDIWKKNEVFRKLRTERPDKCSICDMWYASGIKTCNNGCWAMLLMETGDLKQINGTYIKKVLEGREEK